MSGGELTGGVDTPKGKDKPDRHPWDWYVEQAWVTEQLIETLGHLAFKGHVVWDPACGAANICDVFWRNPLEDISITVLGSDIRVGNSQYHWTLDEKVESVDFLSGEADFVALEIAIEIGSDVKLSIVTNPPYSQQDGKLVRGLAEKFCEKALRLATHKVCALLPIKWLAGEARHAFLTKYPPRFYLILNERPSMPPGNLIEKLGDQAFKRGKVDYMWVVWDKQVVTLPGETRTIHIAPRPKEERS
ncbi:hypothetical protein [Parasphingorhabdus sp.]|uniref:hypothetical protein n=1 Tax=Parasphingorhabdus sp. TaxID=2709688 RepID=UPI00359475D6